MKFSRGAHLTLTVGERGLKMGRAFAPTEPHLLVDLLQVCRLQRSSDWRNFIRTSEIRARHEVGGYDSALCYEAPHWAMP